MGLSSSWLPISTPTPRPWDCSLRERWWWVAQANASGQIYWDAFSFLWILWLVFCVGTGPFSVPPKLEHILWKGWIHHPHLGGGQSLVSFFIQLLFVTFTEQNDTMSNCLPSVFKWEFFASHESVWFPCLLHCATGSPPLQLEPCYGEKILLYHTVTSLTSAVTGFSPKSTKACTTKDEITSPETSLVWRWVPGGLGSPLAHLHLPRVRYIVGGIVISAWSMMTYLPTS